MNVRLFFGILSFCLAMVGCLTANMTYYSMIEAINERRPSDKQLGYLGFTSRMNFFDHLNEYRTLYPQSKFRMRFRIAVTTMFVGLAATVACLMLRFE